MKNPYSTYRRNLLIIAILLWVIAFMLLALTDVGHAAPLEGNRGGCGRGNMQYGVHCTVMDAGNGFVSGTCEYGLWFSRIVTARTFRLDQPVKVTACEGEQSELYAPITIWRR